MAKRKRRNKRRKWSDYTLDEQFTIIMIVIALIFIILHYILAFLGLDPMIELALMWVGTVFLILVKYSIKSFAGKRESEKIKYLRDKHSIPDPEGTDDIFDDTDL